MYLRGTISKCPDIAVEINRRVRLAWLSFKRYSTGLYDRPEANLELKVRPLQAEVMETIL